MCLRAESWWDLCCVVLRDVSMFSVSTKLISVCPDHEIGYIWITIQGKGERMGYQWHWKKIEANRKKEANNNVKLGAEEIKCERRERKERKPEIPRGSK